MELNDLKVGQIVKIRQIHSAGKSTKTVVYEGPVTLVVKDDRVVIDSRYVVRSNIFSPLNTTTEVELIKDALPEPGWYLWKCDDDEDWVGAVLVTEKGLALRADHHRRYDLESFFGKEKDYQLKRVSD